MASFWLALALANYCYSPWACNDKGLTVMSDVMFYFTSQAFEFAKKHDQYQVSVLGQQHYTVYYYSMTLRVTCICLMLTG